MQQLFRVFSALVLGAVLCVSSASSDTSSQQEQQVLLQQKKSFWQRFADAPARKQFRRHSKRPKALLQEESASVSESFTFATVVAEKDQSASGVAAMLRAEIVGVEHKEAKWRHKLAEVSKVAHQGLKDLHNELQSAKESSDKSQDRLRAQLKAALSQQKEADAALERERRLEEAMARKLSSTEKVEKLLVRKLSAAQKTSAELASSQKAEKELRARVAIAEKTENRLRSKLAAEEKVTASLASTEKVERELSTKLVEVETMREQKRANASKAESVLREKLAHLQNESTKEKANEVLVQKRLRANITEVNTTSRHLQEVAKHNETAIRKQLNTTRTAQVKLHTKLAELQTTMVKKNFTLMQNREDRDQMRAKLKDAEAITKQLREELAMEERTNSGLKANLTHAEGEATDAAEAAQKEKMGLLEQVSALQKESLAADKRAAAAEQSLKTTEEETAKRLKEQQQAADKEGQKYNKTIAALRSESTSTSAKLIAAQQDIQTMTESAEELSGNLTQDKQQLGATLHEAAESKAARDAATKDLAALRKRDVTAGKSLHKELAELDSTQKAMRQAKSQLQTNVDESDKLSTKAATLEAQVAAVKQSIADAEAKEKQEMSEKMVEEASQIHAVQDVTSDLSDRLSKEKVAVAAASSEAQNAKDTLVQQTNEALGTSKRVDNLSDQLEKAKKAADQSSVKLGDLQNEVRDMRSDQNSAMSLLDERSHDSAEAQAKAEALESSEAAEAKQADSTEAENKKLREQIEQLSASGQKNDELTETLANLQNGVQKNNTMDIDTEKQLSMLRELKDHYSSEYDSWKNESDTWHSRAQDLDSKLQTKTKQLQAAVHERDAAAEKSKAERSREDQYFDENSRLQNDIQALNTQISEATSSANRSTANAQQLKDKMEEMRGNDARDQQNSHAAWQKNEDELAQVRDDNQVANEVVENSKAEIAKTQAVLTDKQRKALGITDAPARLASAARQVSAAEATWSSLPAAPLPVEPVQPVAKPKQSLDETIVLLKRNPPQPKPAALAGEPASPESDAASLLTSVLKPAPSPPTAAPVKHAGSSLQKLAAYFASPLPG